jgi:RES domain-containing protein
LRFQGTCYRAHDPKWAFSPLSGDGARTHGGRFNPKGVPALYLALTIDGMIAEMTHGFAHRLDPLTICSYQVDVDDVVDLKDDDGREANGVALAALSCAWADDVTDGRYPASWSIADRLIAQGSAGVLVPSFARGARPDMTNLVLWKWGPTLPYRVEVYDPTGRLPKDQTSWSA